MTDKKYTDEEIIKALHEMWDCSYNYEECQHAEIERLKSRMESDYNAKTKAEAYKEFAERLKSYLLLNKKGEVSVIFLENIDNLLKEMVGEK